MQTAALHFQSVEAIAQAFAAASHNRHLYGVDHDRSRSSLQQFVRALHGHLEEVEQGVDRLIALVWCFRF